MNAILLKLIEVGTIFLCEEYLSSYFLTNLYGKIQSSNKHGVKKLNKTFGSNLEHLPALKALHWVNPEKNLGTIYEFNPENHPCF